MAKIIYIAGYGRSGSTVIATILSGHEAVVTVGELNNISRVCSSDQEYCSCGRLGSECNFWLLVRRKWKELTGISDLAEWLKIQTEFENKKSLPFLLFFRRCLANSKKFKAYCSGISGLYEAISIVSGKEYIVDSSKNPIRALALSLIPGLQLSIIHLVRDPRAVAWSLHKSWQANPVAGIHQAIKSTPVFISTLKWMVSNKLAEIALNRLGRLRSMTLRYEDFIENPTNALNCVGQLLGLNYLKAIDRLSADNDFIPGHILAGNRVRMNKKIRLHAEIDLAGAFEDNHRLTFRLVAGWFASRYGYDLSENMVAVTRSKPFSVVTPRRNIFFAVSSLGSGGAERVATILCNAWVARGDNVTLLATFSGRGACFYPLSDKVQLIYLADLVGKTRKSIVIDLVRLQTIRRLIIKNKPDVILSFLTNVNIAILLSTIGLRAPVIVCERTNPGMHKLPFLTNLLRRFLYPQADIVTVQTEDLAANLGPNWCKVRRLETVPNPLSYDLLIEPAPIIRNNNSRRRLLTMGRLVKEKRFEMLIQLFSGLAGDFPDWDLWIVGEGLLRPVLEQQIASLDLSGRVFLPGKTHTPWNDFAQADVFVLASSYEGFPNVLLEAMAIGLPCVSFDCPSGPREITRNGLDALLVPSGDAVEMEASLRRLMSDDMLRHVLGAKARTSVCERYSVENVLHRWDQLFDEVLTHG